MDLCFECFSKVKATCRLTKLSIFDTKYMNIYIFERTKVFKKYYIMNHNLKGKVRNSIKFKS